LAGPDYLYLFNVQPNIQKFDIFKNKWFLFTKSNFGTDHLSGLFVDNK